MLQAIPTQYAGCAFRARREARWAVFFDHLDVGWEYEPEGFETTAGRYLPDFAITLPGEGHAGYVFFEVKPEDAPSDARHRALVEGSAIPLVVARGMPRSYQDQQRESHCGQRTGSAITVLLPGEQTTPAAFVGASWGITPDPSTGWSYEHYGLHFNADELWDQLRKRRRWVQDAPTWTHLALYAPHIWTPCSSPDIDEAYTAARSARFEHGQSGPV